MSEDAIAEAGKARDEIDGVLVAARRLAAEIVTHLDASKESSAAALEGQRAVAQALVDVQAKAGDIAAAATAAVAAKTQIADEQAIIATKSEHIQQAQVHADKVRSDLDRALTSATQQVTEVEGLAARAKGASDAAVTLHAEISAVKGTTQAELLATTGARDAAKAAAETTTTLADKSATIEARIAKYEARLAELETQCATQLETIVGLLPGATSAGLAHAFNDRRQSFLAPGKRWQWLFVGSVSCLVILAATGLWSAIHASPAASYDELLRLWIARLPIAAALVWLAIHSSHESALAKRLEEDYGYKAAVAHSFQGFHQQMSEIGAAGASNAALTKLCEDTLTIISTPPGRIYDKHALATSPAAEFVEAAKSVVGAAKASSAKP